MPNFSIIDEGSQVTLFKNGYILTGDGDSCIECEQCIPECPGDALFMKKWAIDVAGIKSFGSSLAIMPSSCILGEGCEGDCAQVCPVNALSLVPRNDNPPSEGGGGGSPQPSYCELYPETCKNEKYGQDLSNWLKNQCNVLLPKANSALQGQAASWGMTVEAYVADKIGLIASSGGYEALGKVATKAGWAGVAYNSYKSVMAVADGNLTANELIGIASTTLGFISLIPGVGTAVGLGGLAILSAGSLVLGLVSNTDLGKDTVIADWKDTPICGK